MARIRLLVSVAGERGLVRGEAGTEIEVDSRTARAWCDGERAERVIDRQQPIERTVTSRSPEVR